MGVAVRISRYEAEFAHQLRVARLPQPWPEFTFAPPRRWRFDFAWPDRKLAVEIEGGTWVAGRHSRGKGYQDDCEKYNAASLAGWTVLRFTSKHIASGEALQATETALSRERVAKGA